MEQLGVDGGTRSLSQVHDQTVADAMMMADAVLALHVDATENLVLGYYSPLYFLTPFLMIFATPNLKNTLF